MDSITLSRVSKAYPTARGEADRVAVRPLDMAIQPGEFIGLLGPNGSGKSTLLRMLVGLERPSTGTITPPADKAFRAQLGVIFQYPALDSILTVRENLRLAGTLYGLGRAALDSRIASLAEVFGVADRLGSRVGSLSGGLARRVDLARAMLSEPELLVVDEATSSLDQGAREDFGSLIETQRRDQSLTVVMATHRPEEVSAADRVLIMAEGEIVRQGTPSELIAGLGTSELIVKGPSEEATALLLGAGHPLVEQNRSIAVYADRIEPGLIASLSECGACVSWKPTDLTSVYRDAVANTPSVESAAP